MRLGIASGKGGVGKTTEALNLAHQMTLDGSRVLLIDADEQRSASKWAAARETSAPFTVVEAARKTLHREIDELADGYDHVVIDGPPRNADVLRSLILSSTHLIVPVSCSALEVWECLEALDLLDEARARGLARDLKVAIVTSRNLPRTVIGRSIDETIRELLAARDNPTDFPIIRGTDFRTPYIAASNAAMTVQEYDRRGPAALEIASLLNAIREI